RPLNNTLIISHTTVFMPFKPLSFLIFLLAFSIQLKAQGLFKEKDSIVTQTLSEAWELDDEDRNGTFRLNSYQPFYVMPVHWSNRINKQPQSVGQEPAFDQPMELHSTEVKFQLSFKTKVLQSFFFGTGDLWVGYTQTANWQVYNKKLSRPFRELNYE